MSPIRFEGPIKVLRMFSRGVESLPTGSCGIEVEAGWVERKTVTRLEQKLRGVEARQSTPDWRRCRPIRLFPPASSRNQNSHRNSHRQCAAKPTKTQQCQHIDLPSFEAAVK